jgi:hypothetical protein
MSRTQFSGPVESNSGFTVNGTTVIDSNGKIIESAGISLADGDSFDDTSGNEVLQFGVVASAVNEITIVNAATGNNPIIKASGEADTGITFMNLGDEEILILNSIATSVNQLTISSAATGNPVLFSQDGEDDVGFEFHAKNGEEMLKLEATAAAITFVSIKSQSTGNNPEISAEGEADLGITFMNDQAEELLILNCNATAVNELTISNAAAASEPSIAATGSDTDIHIDLTPKGAGNVRATLGSFEEPVQALTTDSSTVNVYGATTIDSTSNKVDCTLGSGTFIGQIKTIVMIEASNASDVSITNHQTSDPEVALFDAVDETGVFMWTGTEWITIFATCTFV